MKSKKTYHPSEMKSYGQQKQVFSRPHQRDPELIEKFYKQIINSFGYAYSSKV